MRIKVMADVHGDLGTVRREAAACDLLLVLGDLINVIDYENCSGVLADVYGKEAVREWAALRADKRLSESRELLRRIAKGREDEMRALLIQKIDEAHKAFCAELPANVMITYGNVDVPALVRNYLPAGVRFVDAEVVELEGARFGFVGGGLPKVGIPGEVSVEDYAAKVEGLGPVDVLCTHIPPSVDDLTYDVVAKMSEPGSVAILEYIQEHQPDYVYYGHVHQPKVARTKIGTTTVVNVGHHYRSTGSALDHPEVGPEGGT